jgi:hypothetical protein
MPVRLVAAALKLAFWDAVKVWYWEPVTTAKSKLMPTISTTADSGVHTVDRSERNFVNSERSTRAWVTFSAGTRAGPTAAVITALTGPPPSRHRRAHCRWRNR